MRATNVAPLHLRNLGFHLKFVESEFAKKTMPDIRLRIKWLVSENPKVVHILEIICIQSSIKDSSRNHKNWSSKHNEAYDISRKPVEVKNSAW